MTAREGNGSSGTYGIGFRGLRSGGDVEAWRLWKHSVIYLCGRPNEIQDEFSYYATSLADHTKVLTCIAKLPLSL